MVARQVLALQAVVQIHLGQQQGVCGRVVRRKFVALVYAGSIPAKLPIMVCSSNRNRIADFQSAHTSSSLVPTTIRFNSTAVVQLTCNEQVVGSNPT